MSLSPQQVIAFDKIMGWMQTSEKRFVLAGYAGAGKTTLARHIADEVGMEDVIFCAYTGKAANVLREKGCARSSTIHGAIYKLVGDEGECPLCRASGVDINGVDCKTCDGAGFVKGSPKFVLDRDSNIRGAKLVIVDEFSMLPKEIREDLEKLARKVLYLGDPFQLPPVNGECDLEPDFFITEIHRQALESPIIRYATDVREGRLLKFCSHPEFEYMSRTQTPPELYEQADQIIVGYNKTRHAWNERFRRKMGFGEFKFPRKGDKIICTRNNHELGLFNGMIGVCKANVVVPGLDERYFKLNFEEHEDLLVWKNNFINPEEKPNFGNSKLNMFDYAYAITCHKSQGSEFDHVLVYNQPIGSDEVERRRWLYTGLTRGKKKVTLVKP